MYIKTIKKEYGKSIKIVRFNRGVVINPPKCANHNTIACQICWPRNPDRPPSYSSIMRSKTLITDYTLSNDFDLFTTFTFDPKKVDSLDVNQAKAKMSKWLNNARRVSPELAYLIVAEKHKSGRIHFHALMKNYKGTLHQTLKTKNNRAIFNITGWNWGFSTAVKIDNISKVSSYMQKYITKDMLKISNKKRFWVSRNLNKPIKTYNVDMNDEVFSKPLFVLSDYKDQYFRTFTILKTDLDSQREINVEKQAFSH